MQANALIGLVSDMLLDAVAESPLDAAAKIKTQRAFTRCFGFRTASPSGTTSDGAGVTLR